MTAAPSTAPDMPSRHGGGIFLALVPWVLFSMLVANGTVEQASLLALVSSALIAVPALRAGRPKLLELGAVATFTAFAVIALALDPSTAETFARYARGIAALVLGGHRVRLAPLRPVHRADAHESSGQQAWSSHAFKTVKRTGTVADAPRTLTPISL